MAIMLRVLAAGLTLVLVPVAGGTTTNASCGQLTETASFGDVQLNPVQSNLPLLNFVQEQGGLEYSGAVLGTQSDLGGVQPHSGTRDIAITVYDDLLEAGQITLTPVGNINAIPEVPYFDLESFYFGCMLNLHTGDINFAISCNLSISGIDKDGKTVGPVNFVYDAPIFVLDKTHAAMKMVTLSGFEKMTTVTFKITQTILGVATDLNAVLLLDDVVRYNYCQSQSQLD